MRPCGWGLKRGLSCSSSRCPENPHVSTTCPSDTRGSFKKKKTKKPPKTWHPNRLELLRGGKRWGAPGGGEPTTHCSCSRQRPHPAHSRPPHPPAGPRSRRAHATRTPGERRDPSRSRRLARRLRSTGAGAGGRSYQGGARSLTRTDPAASVPAPAAPFQALGRTSGRGAEKLRNPRGGRRGSAWPRPRDDARRRAVRRVASGCGNPFGRL